MSRADTRPGRHLLAEPDAIGLPLLVALLVSVLIDQAFALGGFGQFDGSDWTGGVALLQRLLASAVAVGVLVGILGCGRWTWLRWGPPRRRGRLTVVTVLVGAWAGLRARAVVIGALTTSTRPAIAFREVSLLVAATLLLLVVLGQVSRHRRAVDALTATRDRLTLARATTADRLAMERAQMCARVRTLVESRLELAVTGGARFAATELRELAEQVVRPLSHRLEAGEGGGGGDDTDPPSDPPVGLWTSLRGLRPVPFVRPRLLALLMTALVLRLSTTVPVGDAGTLPDGSGPAPAPVPEGLSVTVDWASLTQSLVHHATMFVVVLLGTRLLARRLGRLGTDVPTGVRWLTTLVGLGATGVVALAAIRASNVVADAPALRPLDAGFVLGFVVPMVLATVGFSVFDAATRALADTERTLARTNRGLAAAIARTNALMVHERRVFARRLHASVQSTVNAGSLLLERAADERRARTEGAEGVGVMGDGPIDEAVVERVASMIGAALDGLADDDGPPLADRLARVARSWAELCRIDVSLDDAVTGRVGADAVASATLADLAAEACANAVVHGRATTVRVTLGLLADSEVALQVEDDGRHRGTDRPPGLGSRALEDSCTSWGLAQTPEGTTLRATVPLSPKSEA